MRALRALRARRRLDRADDERQFCCAGCATAFAILHDTRSRHVLRPRRAAERTRAQRRAGATRSSIIPRSPTSTCSRSPDGLAEVELYLEGVHCGSCVWLVERVPLVVPGVARAELEVRRSLARVVWNPAAVPCHASRARSMRSATRRIRSAASSARRCGGARIARCSRASAWPARSPVNVMLAALALYSGAAQRHGAGSTSASSAGSASRSSRRRCSGRGVCSLPARGRRSARARCTWTCRSPIGLAAGYIRGAVNTVQDTGPIYFDGLATLIFALLVGRYLAAAWPACRGRRRGVALLIDAVERARASRRMASSESSRRGARAGDVVDGARRGDVSRRRCGRARTLAARPVAAHRRIAAGGRGSGDRVYAGTLNISAPVRVRVEQAGETRRVAKILRQVEESARARAPIVAAANGSRGGSSAVVLVLAVVTFVVWRAPRSIARDGQRDRAAGRDVSVRARALDAARRIDGDRARGARRHLHQGRRRTRASREARHACFSTRPARSPRRGRQWSSGAARIG